MDVTWLNPEALLAAAVVPALWLVWRGGRDDSPRWQRRGSLAVRSLLVILVALALARPQVVRPGGEVTAVILVDESPSIGAAQREAAQALVREVQNFSSRRGHVLVRPFGGDAPQRDLAAAIRLGTGLAPAGQAGRLLLVSDGNQTRGDALAAAQAARQTGLRVFTATLAPEDRPAVLVHSIAAPETALPGQTVALAVAVESTRDQPALVSVDRGGYRIARVPVRLTRGRQVIRLEAEVEEAGPTVFTVTCEMGDAAPSSGSAITMVRGRGRVLLIEAAEGEERALVRALTADRLDVENRPAAGLPRTVTDLNAFDVVILSDVPATALDRPQMEALATYVNDLGGGLVMIGGENSFGPGGYDRTPLAALLPVRLDSPQREELPGLALVLLIDKSGSMSADQKIELAKDAAVAATEVLTPTDQVAVITFDAASHLLVPLQPARDRERITAAIARLTASGGTSIYPALRDAHLLLSQVKAKLKHVILLSDGRSTAGDFDDIMARLTADRVTVSTVAIGAGADTDLLRHLAQVGGGRAYFTNDPFNIPQIFTQETLTAARRSLEEQPFRPRLGRRSPVVRGLDFDQAPMLLAYVITQPRPGAETILVSHRADPILARWRYGLGTVTAFTSDAKNRWAAEWLDDPLYPRFWVQVVRDALRPLAAGQWRLTAAFADADAGVGRIDLDALDPADEFLNDLTVTARIVGPEGRSQSVALRQTGPGRYAGIFDADRPGAYAVQTVVSRNPGDSTGGPSSPHDGPPGILSPGLREQPGPAGGLIRPPVAQAQALSADADLMRAIAQAGGGRVIEAGVRADIEALFQWIPRPQGAGFGTMTVDEAADRPRDLWPVLVAAALVLFALDVFLRRVRLPERRRA